MTSPIWRNWARNVACTPAELVRPVCEEDVVAAVQRAVARGLPVRVAGSGHSFSSIASTSGLLIDGSGLSGVDAVDEAARTVTLSAGTRVEEVAAALADRGLALCGHGTARHSTVAGVVATGTHGGSAVHPSLGAQIVEARLVAGDGSARKLTEASDPQALSCLRTSLGALGVLTSLVLRCVPARNIAIEERYERFDAVVERLPEWAAAGEFVSLLWFPWSERVVTRRLDPTDEPPTPVSRWAAVRDGWLRGRAGRATVARIGAVRPAWVRYLGEPLLPAPSACVTTTYGAQVFDQPVRLTATEYAVPLDALGSALRALRPALRRVGYFPVLPIEVRPGPAETSPLSPAFGRATGWVSLIGPCGPRFRHWLEAGECVLLDHDGRPHWGKEHRCDAEALAARYPRWDDFRAVRARLDPTGVFRNAYLDRVLGPVANEFRGGITDGR